MVLGTRFTTQVRFLTSIILLFSKKKSQRWAKHLLPALSLKLLLAALLRMSWIHGRWCWLFISRDEIQSLPFKLIHSRIKKWVCLNMMCITVWIDTDTAKLWWRPGVAEICITLVEGLRTPWTEAGESLLAWHQQVAIRDTLPAESGWQSSGRKPGCLLKKSQGWPVNLPQQILHGNGVLQLKGIYLYALEHRDVTAPSPDLSINMHGHCSVPTGSKTSVDTKTQGCWTFIKCCSTCM